MDPQERRAFDDFLDLTAADAAAAEAAVRADPGLLTMRNGACETALHYLAIENYVAEVQLLQRLGASVDTQDDFGSTPLMHAVMLGYEVLVAHLLESGASVDLKTVNDDTALSYAVMRDDARTALAVLARCSRDIQFYFPDLDASAVVRDPNSPLRQQMVGLGLTDPFPD